MINPDNLDFHPKYVNPYYLALMGFNFTSKETVPDHSEFFKSIRSLRNELSNDDIVIMLNHNWRSSKVGAWMIGLCQIEELEKDLFEYLKTRPNHCEHVIINLTLFNTSLGKTALNNFIENQLKTILELAKGGLAYRASDMFERNSLLWAFNAIRYLDSINSTRDFVNLLNSEIWSEIKRELLEISKSNPRATAFHKMFDDAEHKDIGFLESIKMIEKDNKEYRS